MLRWSARLAFALVALAGVLAAADAVAARILEARVEHALAESLDADVRLDAPGFPRTLRLLTRGIPRAQVTATAAGRRFARLEIDLDALRLEPATLVDGRPWVRLRAETARATITFAGAGKPLGLGELRAVARDLHGSVGPASTTAAAAELTVSGAERGASASARATDLALSVPPAGDVRLIAGDARVRASGPGLPLPVEWMELVLGDGAVAVSGDLVTVTAAEARVSAADVPVPDSPAVLRGFTADLPRLRATRSLRGAAETTIVRSDGGLYRARLDEGEANRLWTLPGRVRFSDGVARLEVGEMGVDVAVGVRDGSLVLTPILPPLLRPILGDLPPLVVDTGLPEGAAITGVVVSPGVVEIAGRAEQVVLPPV